MKEADRGLYFGQVKVMYDMLCSQASYEPETTYEAYVLIARRHV